MKSERASVSDVKLTVFMYGAQDCKPGIRHCGSYMLILIHLKTADDAFVKVQFIIKVNNLTV